LFWSELWNTDVSPSVSDAGGGDEDEAEHVESVPPPEPRHDHVHGPVPETTVDVPALHRLTGGDDSVAPLSAPQAPLTAVGGGGGPPEQSTGVPGLGGGVVMAMMVGTTRFVVSGTGAFVEGAGSGTADTVPNWVVAVGGFRTGHWENAGRTVHRRHHRPPTPAFIMRKSRIAP